MSGEIARRRRRSAKWKYVGACVIYDEWKRWRDVGHRPKTGKILMEGTKLNLQGGLDHNFEEIGPFWRIGRRSRFERSDLRWNVTIIGNKKLIQNKKPQSKSWTQIYYVTQRGEGFWLENIKRGLLPDCWRKVWSNSSEGYSKTELKKCFV